MRSWYWGRVTAFALLCLLVACGGSKRDEVYARIAEINKDLYDLETKTSPRDQETLAIIEECRDLLQNVQHAIIEDDYKKAMFLLDTATEKLAQAGGKKPKKAPKTNLAIRPFGDVTFQGESGGFIKLTEDRDIAELRAVKTGARSGLVLKPFENVNLFLPPQSECRILGFEPKRQRISLAVDNGELILDKKGAGGEISIEVNDSRISARNQASLEVKNQPLAKRRYVALFEGRATWEDGGETGLLEKYSGLQWDSGSRMQIQLPITPNIEAPEAGQTFTAEASGKARIAFRWSTRAFVPRYHLQVSANEHFLTRVFDKQNLTTASARVDLKHGKYYWRIRGYSNEGVPGPFTETRELKVAQTDQDDPTGAGQKPREEVDGPPIRNLKIEVLSTMVIVGGRTTADAKVTVNGVAAVMMDEGSFRAILNFNDEGQHDLRILATDNKTGGETILEKKVQIRF